MAKKKTPKAKPGKSAKPAAKAPAKSATKAPAKGKRASWFDDKSNEPLIDNYARKLDSFLAVIQDNKVEAKEVKAQEDRLIKLMKEVEPKLDDQLHAKVTELLCELTAYDLMNALHEIQASRPATTFRG